MASPFVSSYSFSIMYGPVSWEWSYLNGYFSFSSLICAVHSGCLISGTSARIRLRTSFSSPTTLASTTMFLLISAASTSIWRIFAFFAKVFVFPVTRSLNLAPSTIRRSQPETPRLEVLVPCIPSIPVYRGSSPENPPLPIRLSHTGASILWASSVTSLDASEIIVPPPVKINGLFASLIICTAVAMSSSLMVSVFGVISAGAQAVYSYFAPVTSLVTSTSTGPGRPLFAI